MSYHRLRFSLAVTTFATLTAIIPPAPASGLQLYSLGARTGSNAVANHVDSLPTVASSGGAAVSDSSVVPTSATKVLFAPAGEKGTGLSGKVFARFVMPEDWIAIASLPGASVASASLQSASGPS